MKKATAVDAATKKRESRHSFSAKFGVQPSGCTAQAKASTPNLTAETRRTQRLRPWERTHPASCVRGVRHSAHAGSGKRALPRMEALCLCGEIFFRCGWAALFICVHLWLPACVNLDTGI